MITGHNFRFILAAGLVVASQSAFSFSSAWKEEEVTTEYMKALTKEQCMEKTVYSLMAAEYSEDDLAALVGITDSCIVAAKGSASKFCESYPARFIGAYCGTNELDARSCVVISVTYDNTCFTPKYK